jgi:hypothetical protein
MSTAQEAKTMRLLGAVVASLLLPGVALAQTPDEPGITPPPAVTAPPEPGTQVIDIEVPDVPLSPDPRLVPVQLVQPACVDRGPFLRLSLGGGYTSFAVLFSESGHGPALHGTLAMTFGGGRVKHGIRAGTFYLHQMEGEVDHLFESKKEAKSRVWGANISYVAQWSSFWLSAGWGFIHLDTDEYDHDGAYDSSDTSLLPEAIFGLGFDIPVSRHVSLRLAGELATFLISYRASASAGLVLRF